MSGQSAFRAVRTVGTALPPEAIPRASELRMPGQTASEYDLPPGMAVNGAVARAWEAMLAAHQQWRASLSRLPVHDAATKLTREKWLLPLLYELGWGRPEVISGGLAVAPGLSEAQAEAPHFPISHRVSWPDAATPTAWVPLDLLGAGIDLDTKTASVTARAPQSMLQDYLNREDKALWGIVSNGHQLRLLRDASTLTRQSFVEFDLDAIFGDQLYADFRLLFLTVHASRFAPRLDDKAAKAAADDDEGGEDSSEPASPKLDICWLERWRATAIDDGARALQTLQHQIAAALQELGTGFVSQPANTALRETLASAGDADHDLQRALLRIAYRLIVLFVVEDRDLLHAPAATTAARALYADFFSTARLRRMAAAPIGGWHTDLWDGHQIVTDALAGGGLPALGLSGLGASLFARDALSILDGAKLPNRALLAAVRALSQIEDPVTGTPRSVDYRNLDSEELGGMYEGLLAYTPRYDADDRTFTLEVATGNDRKTSGSYYTPSALIELVLGEALDPLIDEALHAPNPEGALLDLTIIDPACGSGHFVVAAARKLASALAVVRTSDTEPTEAAVRAATADVIERCVYGVDLNDLAIEITKVALWLEAFDAERPFPFLDAHFRVGNALLGTTPELLRHNVPDAAFAALGDDDKTWTSRLKARNKTEREANTEQLTFGFDPETLNVETSQFTKAAHDADTGHAATVAATRARADAWRRLETDPDLITAKRLADAWCSAFVQTKTGATTSGLGITHTTLRDLAENPESVPDGITATVNDLARQYRFFHWHLEFPGVFTVAESGEDDTDTGWTGGFSCVVGNPPWDALQLEDKQFFGNLGRKDIENAPNADLRKKLIGELETTDPDLCALYNRARRTSDAINHLVRGGRYPFTAQGKINTYSVFAETMRTITGPGGFTGIITPTGLATDKTTSPFFADTLINRRLSAFYDFENEAKIFRDVHNQFRFAVTAMTGVGRQVARTRFAFYTRYITDVPERRFELAADEVLGLNPNTGTLPTFRSRIDADITLGIYLRHPILIRDDDPDGNPWGLSFSQGLFNMASDSGLFHRPEDFHEAEFNGWSYTRQGKEYVPLYEAKMLSHFDHRYSTYRGASQAQLNKGTLPRLSGEQHDDPYVEPLARYWVDQSEVAAQVGDRWDHGWFLGWRNITNTWNERTSVSAVLPASAVNHAFPLAFPRPAEGAFALHAVWSSLAYDYVVRQKLSGTNLTYTTLKQVACPPPNIFALGATWCKAMSLGEWTRRYLLELSYTSWRLKSYATDLGDNGPPFRWDPARRSLLRADFEAGFFHVYGLDHDEAEHVIDSFSVIRKYEERDHGEYRTRRLVLEAYERMAAAIAIGGKDWRPLADICAGDGPRHDK